MAKAEPRMTLVTGRGRQMGALPLAPGEPYSELRADRLERLWTGALAAPSQALVKLIYRSRCDRHPKWCDRPFHEAQAG